MKYAQASKLKTLLFMIATASLMNLSYASSVLGGGHPDCCDSTTCSPPPGGNCCDSQKVDCSSSSVSVSALDIYNYETTQDSKGWKVLRNLDSSHQEVKPYNVNDIKNIQLENHGDGTFTVSYTVHGIKKSAKILITK